MASFRIKRLRKAMVLAENRGKHLDRKDEQMPDNRREAEDERNYS